MRRLYIGLALAGGLAPTVIFFMAQQEQRSAGASFDLGLLLFSAGLGLLFAPLGAALGLALAALLQWLWSSYGVGFRR